MIAKHTLRSGNVNHGASCIARYGLWTLGLAFAVGCPLLSAGQTTTASSSGPSAATAAPAPSSVFVNERAGADDPRVGLKPGLYDAGVAAAGLKLVLTMPKPAGFAPDPAAIAAYDAAPTPAPGAPRVPQRGAQPFGTTNSDIAFAGNHLFVGNYNGINFYDISDPSKLKLITSMVCPGGQGDVSVYGNLLFMSVEAANGRLDCGTQGFATPPGATPPPNPDPAAIGSTPGAASASGAPPARPTRALDPASPDRVKGIRIFDISDIAHPRQITDVQTCRGSHTHTLVVDPKDHDNVYVYISGSAGVRPTEELGGCTAGEAGVDANTALYTIVVVKVPLAHPEQAKVVNSPYIFKDEATGNINGLWKGGNHGEGTQTTSMTRGCHDITVYSAIGLAAGACSGNGILLDISDAVHPKRIDAVSDPNYAFWHSANFANDGSAVLFTDEWGGGGQPRCRSSDPMNWGADAIFTLKDRKLTLASYYKMPAPQTEFENCVAHNGSMIPVPGRNIEVQSWYQGGVSIVDYTDPSHPFEIGYFDRGPIDGVKHALGGQWSTYWYNGHIYGSEIVRGVDVLDLVPSQYLSQTEIDAANTVHFGELNVQNQPKVTWPNSPIVAQAYVEQLKRANALPEDEMAKVSAAAAKAGSKKDAKLAASLDKDAASAKTPADAKRLHALAEMMRGNKS